MEELLELSEAIISIEQDVNHLKYMVQKMIKEAVRQDIHSFGAHAPEGSITLGHWECKPRLTPASLTGLCVYDDWKDPPHDSCIYCGQPEERK